MKERVNFTKNPFKYLLKLLGDKRSGKLKATKEQVEEHLRQVHSEREDSLEEMEKLIKPAEPTIPFGAGGTKLAGLRQAQKTTLNRRTSSLTAVQYVFHLRDFTTDWQRLEVGIVTGCTILGIMISAAMNLLVKSAEKLHRDAVLASGIQ
ncbi:hypothetical protein N1851_013923 [Merluccius polli]|uniref:Uncharacterized protein n=1 Tax=Merluccius polli TaxID=89951 RepID=A0AA47MV40_MERPO|nr:hypothetical protein N1851_013923 [Merluccius polli]